MILNEEKGGYMMGQVVRLCGGFKYTASGNVVDTIRDGRSKCIASVSRTSAGLYRVTFDTGFPIPERCVTKRAWKTAGSSTPAKACIVEVVEGSYSQSGRYFDIVVTVVGDTANSAYADPVVGDPDDASRIEFELVGSISSPGTDPA